MKTETVLVIGALVIVGGLAAFALIKASAPPPPPPPRANPADALGQIAGTVIGFLT